ncbi:MAG: hydrogenase maturation protease [Pirellulaceae bacterium]
MNNAPRDRDSCEQRPAPPTVGPVSSIASPLTATSGPCTAPAPDAAAGRTLVIGLGNPLISDDSVGLRVSQQLKTRLAQHPDVDVSEDYWGGLRLMERMIGYERAIVVDAICSGAAPGTIHHLSTEMLATQRSASAHDVNLPTALAFGRQAGAQLPADHNIRLVAIEAQDVVNFSEHCTVAVAAAIPRAVHEVVRLLETMLGEPQK